jgi:hypothetical protein
VTQAARRPGSSLARHRCPAALRDLSVSTSLREHLENELVQIVVQLESGRAQADQEVEEAEARKAKERYAGIRNAGQVLFGCSLPVRAVGDLGWWLLSGC